MKKAMIAGIALALWIGLPAGAETIAGDGVPKVLTLGSLSKDYEPVRFDHSAHIDTAGGCAECHHQHGAGNVRTCSECHRIDPAAFRKNVDAGKLKPCGECHPASARAGEVGRPTLKAAYHRACFQCHRGEVGSVGNDPKGCTEMCHLPRAQAKLDEKK